MKPKVVSKMKLAETFDFSVMSEQNEICRSYVRESAR